MIAFDSTIDKYLTSWQNIGRVPHVLPLIDKHCPDSA
jgi:hypothetical protein